MNTCLDLICYVYEAIVVFLLFCYDCIAWFMLIIFQDYKLLKIFENVTIDKFDMFSISV